VEGEPLGVPADEAADECFTAGDEGTDTGAVLGMGAGEPGAVAGALLDSIGLSAIYSNYTNKQTERLIRH